MSNLSTTKPPPAVLAQLANVSHALEQVRNLEESTDWLKRANAVEQVAKAAGVAHEIKVQAFDILPALKGEDSLAAKQPKL